jgi:hypothetical protein
MLRPAQMLGDDSSIANESGVRNWHFFANATPTKEIEK